MQEGLTKRLKTFTTPKCASPNNFLLFLAILERLAIVKYNLNKMNENERLTPICIIYLDGVRLSPALEGAFRSANVYDKMNGVGRCVISFDNNELKQEDKKSFGHDMRLSVHMGYKDNTKEVFNGEITEKTINLSEYGCALFIITASSFLWRLDRGEHTRVFTNQTPSQAVKEILSRYDLQSDCDKFGACKGHWEGGMNISDLDLVLGLAKRFGKDVCTFGDKVYVKEQMTHLKDEIIYEWGKSLISFDVKESIEEQVSKIHMFGWNHLMKKEFRTEVNAGDIEQKTGGRNPWTKVSKGGSGFWVDYHYCAEASDSEEAKELALALMRENSFKYMRAEGSGEGNCKLSAGVLVTVKYVGTTFSGDYIAECVVHRFSLDDGYITDFYLKRNMVSDEYVKLYARSGSAAQGGGGLSGKNGNSGVVSETDEDSSAYADDEEDENAPEFRSLVWKKDGKEISEALVDDEVALFCEVKNIDDGETVKFKIFEQGENKDDPVDEVTGTVKDGKVEVPWKVVYKGDAGSNVAEELEEQGWTVPWYCFVVKYGGVESHQSKVLDIKGEMDYQLLHPETGELLINHEYTLVTSEGKVLSGKSDENGNIKLKGIKLGDFSITGGGTYGSTT